MSVRLTPIESGTTPPTPVPAPPESSEHQVTDQEDGVAAVARRAPATDSRIALREARRARRRTAWLCAAVVALALALTIVVVSLARNRPTPSSSAVLAAARSAHTAATPSAHPAAPGSTPLPAIPSLGAAAPEGGNR